MTNRIPLIFLMICSATACRDDTAYPAQPNIIFIYTDDQGFTDLGVQGIDAHVDTPYMDTLAQNGAVFSNGYSTAPQCRPSRAGLMTGQYQNRFGFLKNRDQFLPLAETTIADRMSAQGYTTGFVGKWHLGPETFEDPGNYPGEEVDYRPGNRGFDEYWAGLTKEYEANFDLDGNTIEPTTIIDTRNRIVVQAEAASAFIDRNHGSPFFLYLAFFGPHVPRISKLDSYYLGFPELDYPQYSAEMDDIRRQGLALVKAIDDGVNTVMQKLREHGLEENTAIFFASDNGAQPKFWRSLTSQTSIDKWNGSDNVPLRGEKGSLWEGGIKVPMWVYWKGSIPGGQTISDPVITLDFVASALRLAGAAVPDEVDGIDLLPRLADQTPLIRPNPLYWSYPGEIAIRKGDWKLRRVKDGDYLFNLSDDPNELNNMSLKNPEKLGELSADLSAWERSLPPEGRATLKEDGATLYVDGAPAGTVPDPRYRIPDAQAYPAPIAFPRWR